MAFVRKNILHLNSFQSVWFACLWLISALSSVKAVTVITSCNELQAMRNNLTESYQLGGNINCSDTLYWNAGQGFEPIGDNVARFEGMLDGQGYRVTNLFINRPSGAYVGLFGYTHQIALITVFVLEGVDIVGGDMVGGLAGTNNGLIINVTVTGSIVTPASGSSIGGLVGENYGSIINVSAAGSVSSVGAYTTGGLVGYNDYASITNAYAAVSVLSMGAGQVGGLVGYNFVSFITNVHASGSVSSINAYSIGGLVGLNLYASITNAHAIGTVNSTGGHYVGGLVGTNEYASSIINASASGAVSNIGNDAYIGGLVGWNWDASSITSAYATGSVLSMGDGDSVGGLVGNNRDGPITNTYATGSVSSIGDSAAVGGLIGYNDYGTITNAIAIGLVLSAGEGIYVGGLVGRNDNVITDVTASGSVSSTGDSAAVGGLVGYNTHNCMNAVTTGFVSSLGDSADVGGLVGDNRGSLVNVSTTSPVLGIGNYGFVGGLVGYNRGSIINASVASSVTGDDHVGGLVGLNELGSQIDQAVATGVVSGNQTVGGLVGLNEVDAFIRFAFTNSSVSGKSQVGGLVGLNQGSLYVVYSLSQVTGQSVVGGLIGLNNGPSVTNAYFIGEVSGGYYIGGIAGNVGVLVGTMSAIYVSGCIDGTHSVGALVGGLLDSNLIYAVYWDKQVTLHDQASGGSANFDLRKNKKNTRDLYKKTTYADWDFNNTWAIDEGHSYPYLKALFPLIFPKAPSKNCPQTTAYIWIFLHTILIPTGGALTLFVIVWFMAYHRYQRSAPEKQLNQVSYLLPVLVKLGRLSCIKRVCEDQTQLIDDNTVSLSLKAAAETGRENVVLYLLEQYQDSSQLNKQIKTDAAQIGYDRRYSKITALLVKNEDKENKFANALRLTDLQSRLFFALENQRYPGLSVIWLAKEKVDTNVLNVDGQTPVMVAMQNNHFDEALTLVRRCGADVLMINYQGETVIDQLLQQHKVIEARQLLSANKAMGQYRAVYLYMLKQVEIRKFKDIDLSKLLLNDEDLLELAQSCFVYQDVEALDLSYNPITSSGIFYLVKVVLLRQPKLQRLDFRHTLIGVDDVSFLKSSLSSTIIIEVDEHLKQSITKSSSGCMPASMKKTLEKFELWLTVWLLHLQSYQVIIALAFLLEMLNKLFDLLLIESLWVNKQYDLAYASLVSLLIVMGLGFYGFRAASGYWIPHDWREGWRVILLPLASPQLVHLEWGISFVNPQFAWLKVVNFGAEELSQTVIILIFFIRKGIKLLALIKLVVSLVTSVIFLIKMLYYAPVLRKQFHRWRQHHRWFLFEDSYQRQASEEEVAINLAQIINDS